MVASFKVSLKKGSPHQEKDSPFFDVKEVPLIRSDNHEESSRIALINMDSNKSMGEVSKRYRVTTHREASTMVKDFLTEIGLPFESMGPRVAKGGAQFFEALTFPEMTFNPIRRSTALDTPGLHKDDLVPGLSIRNSYDRSSPIGIDYWVYRLICLNGMAIPVEQTTFSCKHSQVLNRGQIQSAIFSQLEKSSCMMESFAQKLNESEGTDLLEKILKAGFSDVFKEKLIEKLNPCIKMTSHEVEKEQRKFFEIDTIHTDESAWAIYNVATDLISHNLGNVAVVNRESKRLSKVVGLVA